MLGLQLVRRGAIGRVNAFHSKSPINNTALLRDLETTLKTDPEVAQRLSALLSPSTSRNLSRALESVRKTPSKATATSEVATAAVADPTTQELKMVALQMGLPFIGFGFVDNFIMILAGDYIDLTLGVSLGISSMAAAGIGNTISDIAGLGLGNVVEDFCARIGLPVPALTSEQMLLKSTRLAKVAGSSIGVTIGCLLGMVGPFVVTQFTHMNDIKMPSPHVAEGVAQAVLRWFESSSQCQKKIPVSEWTVLSGIVLCTSDDESKGSFRVLSAATGNKCLGRRDLNVDGLVVNDCHAEVLSRRAFLRYLYTEVLYWQRNNLELSDESIFKRHSTSSRLKLKPQYSLHLFISEAPCGDAAIYELQQQVVDELVQQRASRGAETERSELRLTGAKRSSDHQDTTPDKKFAQTVGIARVKSGRSDLPVDKQTLSMSCSDKLAKWNALGLQGSLLLQWFEPIFLSSIVVSEDTQALSGVKQKQALRRALCERLEERDALIQGDKLVCEACVVSEMFNRRRAADLSPASLAINWTTRESHWSQAGTTDKQKATEADKFVVKFFNNFELEFLMAATGFKQGAKKASKMDRVAMERVASRLAKRNLLRAFHHILSQESQLTGSNSLGYLQLKRAVPLSASPLTPSALSATPAGITYNDRREQFFEAFSDWIGVPTTLKQFKL
ncbi:tRNA-specific adenosine deaminase 1 [Phytophthora citrophthora]|uniref:tRNA-specific adenosine deaminase 1 n=1 Tax=Phytophthora citrophthora TaxID=4793 RepID=A0AAD9GUL0_9STRA|nr:tRNA-specific adenosine deaminase 1 [Phytophthora citrophthora]